MREACDDLTRVAELWVHGECQCKQTVLSIPLGTRGGQLFSRADTIMYLCLCCLHRNLHSYQLDIYE
jgi:hypothetical protein